MGRSGGRQWGDPMAAYGEILMAAVSRHGWDTSGCVERVVSQARGGAISR